MTEWHPLARSEELAPRHIFHGQLRSIELALWRADDGTVNAWENRCPHRSVRLTLGINLGDRLRCQYHGWHYRSGDARCVAIPAASRAVPSAAIAVRRFAACEAHGFVWVALTDEPAAAPFETDFLPLAVGLRSLPVREDGAKLRDALRSYGTDDSDFGGWDEVLCRGHQMDLVQRAGTGARHVRFWLQPAADRRTILHGWADETSPSAPEVQRRHSQWMNRLRRQVEA